MLRLDVRAERADASLRLAGAVVCGLGALTIAALEPTLVGWVVVLVASLASVGWAASYAGARRRTSVPIRYTLTLGADALALCEAGRVETLRWEAVRAVDVDEDRLVVRVHRREGGAPLVLEPRYEGVSVYALAELVGARVCPAASQTGPAP